MTGRKPRFQNAKTSLADLAPLMTAMAVRKAVRYENTTSAIGSGRSRVRRGRTGVLDRSDKDVARDYPTPRESVSRSKSGSYRLGRTDLLELGPGVGPPCERTLEDAEESVSQRRRDEEACSPTISLVCTVRTQGRRSAP